MHFIRPVLTIVLVIVAVALIFSVHNTYFKLPEQEPEGKFANARKIVGTPVDEEETRKIVIKVSYAGYEPDTVFVKPNERVRIIVQSQDVHHGIAITDLGLWGEDYVEFTAPSQPQSISFQCGLNCEPQEIFVRDGKRYVEGSEYYKEMIGVIHVQG